MLARTRIPGSEVAEGCGLALHVKAMFQLPRDLLVAGRIKWPPALPGGIRRRPMGTDLWGRGLGARIRAGASLGELLVSLARRPHRHRFSPGCIAGSRRHAHVPRPRSGRKWVAGVGSAVHDLPRNVLCRAPPPRRAASGGEFLRARDALQQDQLEVSQRDEMRAPRVAPTAAMIVSNGSPPPPAAISRVRRMLATRPPPAPSFSARY